MPSLYQFIYDKINENRKESLNDFDKFMDNSDTEIFKELSTLILKAENTSEIDNICIAITEFESNFNNKKASQILFNLAWEKRQKLANKKTKIKKINPFKQLKIW
jgi:F0F1-type ATP synthase gamma subunit